MFQPNVATNDRGPAMHQKYLWIKRRPLFHLAKICNIMKTSQNFPKLLRIQLECGTESDFAKFCMKWVFSFAMHNAASRYKNWRILRALSFMKKLPYPNTIQFHNLDNLPISIFVPIIDSNMIYSVPPSVFDQGNNEMGSAGKGSGDPHPSPQPVDPGNTLHSL
jgi:hypothetical protein